MRLSKNLRGGIIVDCAGDLTFSKRDKFAFLNYLDNSDFIGVKIVCGCGDPIRKLIACWIFYRWLFFDDLNYFEKHGVDFKEIFKK